MRCGMETVEEYLGDRAEEIPGGAPERTRMRPGGYNNRFEKRKQRRWRRTRATVRYNAVDNAMLMDDWVTGQGKAV